MASWSDQAFNGEWKWLFRAVNKHGRTVDFLLTHRRNANAARRFLAKALRTRQHWPPQVINTDHNPAYGEALRQLKRDDPDVCQPIVRAIATLRRLQ